ncbi:MAG TPA: UDP-N-acetylmuramate dehydrogenase [Clostridiaceae bacterium]|nr:UDP-N-acetylmuramate dehydrogenase [Clostridiaceae bacterium]
MQKDGIDAFAVNEVVSILSQIENVTLEREAPIAGLTRFRAGGHADVLVHPHTVESAIELIRVVQKSQLPLTIIGCASNVLVSDRGIRGVTCRLHPVLSAIRREGNRLFCQAGVSLHDVAAFAAKHSLGGVEFAAGIPGSIGGAVFMNAGAFGGSMSDVVQKTTFIDGDGCIRDVVGNDHDFGYRHSFFVSSEGAVILETELCLEHTDLSLIYEKMAENAYKRYRTQPLDAYSAGSAFRRPEGYFAGKLISDAGMKGYRRGNAGVSGKHAGFIVNYGGATAEEIAAVFRDVRAAVYEMEGVILMPEVRLIGEWDGDPFAFEC